MASSELIYFRLRAEKKCVTCWQSALENNPRCALCREKHMARERERRARAK